MTRHVPAWERTGFEVPQGDGKWPGFAYVYGKISAACDKMGASHSTHCGDDHVETMGDLGSGHEERMKYRLAWLREYGWI